MKYLKHFENYRKYNKTYEVVKHKFNVGDFVKPIYDDTSYYKIIGISDLSIYKFNVYRLKNVFINTETAEYEFKLIKLTPKELENCMIKINTEKYNL